MSHLERTGSLVGLTLNDRYEVLEKIGEGGFGTIYLAKQIQMGRKVALKVLNPFLSKDPKLVERFRREARAACNLRDPHTIVTYDFDETPDGVLYMAMEYLKGQNLYELLDEMERLPPKDAVDIALQCCSSLAEAHAQGIVHRDIKPENIFLERRQDAAYYVKILDFGIAKIVSGDEAQNPALTAAGQTLGTLEYMSPEQLTGKALDGRSDIYSLGMVLYEMLTGDLPFQGDSPAVIIKGHLKDPMPPPSQLAPDAALPVELDRIVLKMVAKKKEDRYRDALELAGDLRTLLTQMETRPSAAGSRKSVWPWVVGGATALVGALLLVLWLAGVL